MEKIIKIYDWLRTKEGDGYLEEYADIDPMDSGMYVNSKEASSYGFIRLTSGSLVVHKLSMCTKLKPSEVIVTIGCLSGTIKMCMTTNRLGFEMFHGKDVIAWIAYEALDPERRHVIDRLFVDVDNIYKNSNLAVSLSMSNTRYIERCEVCGRFIADNELGISAVKTSENYMSGFTHKECIEE